MYFKKVAILLPDFFITKVMRVAGSPTLAARCREHHPSTTAASGLLPIPRYRSLITRLPQPLHLRLTTRQLVLERVDARHEGRAQVRYAVVVLELVERHLDAASKGAGYWTFWVEGAVCEVGVEQL